MFMRALTYPPPMGALSRASLHRSYLIFFLVSLRFGSSTLMITGLFFSVELWAGTMPEGKNIGGKFWIPWAKRSFLPSFLFLYVSRGDS